MRRKDREITDREAIESILKKADVCRLGMAENNIPYIVPMNFGYKDGFIYLHCAKEGRKLDIIRQNNNICFEVDIDNELVLSEDASECTMKYYSVIGFGKAFIVNEYEEKVKALDAIMEHHTGTAAHSYPERAVNAVVVIKVEIDSMTGKKSV